MANKDLIKKAHLIGKDCWWYEEKQGISVWIKTFTEIGCPVIKIHDIPWRSIRATLTRKDKK